MKVRSLVLLGLIGLLSACSSDPTPKPASTTKSAPTAPDVKQIETPGPLPAYQRELSGTLLGVPAGAQVELALLVIDEKDRPQRLLASSTLAGSVQPLPFALRFSPEAFPAGARVELRGRASQSGQLILHLPAVRVYQATTQAMGPLTMEKAP